MKPIIAPRLRSLDRHEVDEVLARNHVGRIAYARGSHIDIEPIHYVYAKGWLYGRTSPGRPLDITGAGWWPVAFEVDEVEDLFHWRSVVVHGGFYTLDPRGSAWEREEAATAIELISQRLPQSSTDSVSVTEGVVVFRIAVQEVSGRAAEPAAEMEQIGAA
jgi:nitroimidazol reductase NimA-like FMN-containing flavoprotein (pyridoxamine 5'-phosphate oxidase superfamily)